MKKTRRSEKKDDIAKIGNNEKEEENVGVEIMKRKRRANKKRRNGKVKEEGNMKKG